MNAPLRDDFIAGMSRAAATVSIVTTDGPAGRAGVTVSAMSSVSADGDAPTLLVCVHHLSPVAATVLANGCFAVNVLRSDQTHISDTFAGRRKDAGDRFACAGWVPMATGAPRVADPLVAFDCTVQSAERVGTHHIFIGAVRETHLSAAGTPLVYANRAYGAPTRLIAPAEGAGDAGSALRIGCLAAFGPSVLPAVLAAFEAAEGAVDLDLHEGDQRQLLALLREGSIDLAFLYDFDLGSGITRLPIAEVAPYVLLPEGHALAATPALTVADLLGHRMVLLDAPPSRDYFLSLFDGVGAPRIGYRAQSFEMVRGLVANGLGYAILATRPASMMSHDGRALVVRPLHGAPRTSRLVLTGRAGAAASPATEAFLFHTAHVFGLDLA